MDELLVCLDGSRFAEKILPFARGMADAAGAKLTLLRIAADQREFLAAEDYLRDLAKDLGALARTLLVCGDPATTILEEVKKSHRSIPALTTHGRSGLVETLMGSVALRVVRGAGRPVLIYYPQTPVSEAAVKMSRVVVPLDGTKFSERIVPHAAGVARQLRARLTVVQALAPQAPQGFLAGHAEHDILESSYVHRQSDEIRRKYSIEADWEVLHGDPAEAICRYVQGGRDTLLAMTSHARGGLERTLFGSVAAHCVRRAGTPVLIYWPRP
ncbi:MAG TPA: universal stress protein [Candidatus Acidoferrales bacterium]|nr:universal stress protein [Candidatus Acidoferrales bacterium]